MLCFNDKGLLPKGIHEIDLSRFEEFFGFNYKRQDMIARGLIPFLKELKSLRVQKVYLDGSFVTQEENPSDMDGYIPASMESRLFLTIAENQSRWQEIYRMHVYAAMTDYDGEASQSWWETEFARVKHDSNREKGFVSLNINERR